MRGLRTSAAVALLLGGAATSSLAGFDLWRAGAENRKIAALETGHDVPAGDDASALLLVSRASFLIGRGNIEAAQAIAERLRNGGNDELRASLFFSLGNAHMRHAYGLFKQVPFRLVKPFIVLAKSEYRQCLQLDPENWDARYNYALAASLVRDTETATPTSGDEMSHERAAWPDIPGAPNGMP